MYCHTRNDRRHPRNPGKAARETRAVGGANPRRGFDRGNARPRPHRHRPWFGRLPAFSAMARSSAWWPFESAGVPVPGETSVTIASLLASASIGRLAYTIGRLGTTGVVMNAAVLGIGTFAAHNLLAETEPHRFEPCCADRRPSARRRRCVTPASPGRSGLVGPPCHGVEIALCGRRARSPASRPAKDVGDPDGKGGTEQWPGNVHPVACEVARDQIRSERSAGIHGRARDRASPQPRERDVAADAERPEHADVLGPEAVPRITLTSPIVSTASIRNAAPVEYPEAG